MNDEAKMQHAKSYGHDESHNWNSDMYPVRRPNPENKSNTNKSGEEELGFIYKTGGISTDNEKKNKKSESKEPTKPLDNTSEWGYDMYPARQGSRPKASIQDVILKGEGRDDLDKMKCERNVYKCVKNSPIVKLMMGALKSSGCDIDIRRHISCEYCDTTVSGGYDPLQNQIVVCQNVARSEGIVQGILTHEMVHMYDYCTKNLDFKNIDHLACTEIRAANLTHCSFLSAWAQGDASPINVKQKHEECVKTKAIQSIKAVRNVTHEEAAAAVERTFSKCYADLEPVGRRIRRNSQDMLKAYIEGTAYGYDSK